MAKNQLDVRIDAICKRTHTLGADIHKLGVDLLQHALEHNDPRKMDRLLLGLHRSARPEAFKVWVETYSPVRWNGDGKVGIMKATSKKYTPFDLPKADANPYWTPAEKVGKPLTFAQLQAMILQMGKKLDKAEDNDMIAEGENVIVMRAFVKRMEEAAALAA